MNNYKATSLQRIGTNPTREREQYDYYATSPEAIDTLLKNVNPPNGAIYECCCGGGHLAERLRQHGYNVIATDLINRGYGQGGVDFLQVEELPGGVHTICTNPPYNISTDIIEHGLQLMQNGDEMYMFLKTLYIEGKNRYDRIFSKYPPYKVIQFIKRIVCAKNGDFQGNSGGGYVSFAWFCWRKGYNGKTQLEWGV